MALPFRRSKDEDDDVLVEFKVLTPLIKVPREVADKLCNGEEAYVEQYVFLGNWTYQPKVKFKWIRRYE